MQITAGTRLGPYEIVAPIGAGGMGEVYKAHDSRLERSVAIKVLPSAFAENSQLKLRFEREAKIISQLSHPHICTLYDVGNEQGVEYLVMELLEGETLADRVARGPLPMRDVLRYGSEIAGALDRAHRAGVVHRDLKPGNVMITKSGAKLLDFGLAKSGPIDNSGDGATIQKSLTQEGTILGTFQYMAPEQLEGSDADARTDLFALGVVLYEMATGRRAFEGKTRTSLIASIVGSEPKPLRELQPLTPPAFEHVVEKCLSKDPEHRWQSASDVASELEWIRASSSQELATGVSFRRKGPQWMAVTAIVALALVAAGLAAAMWARRSAPEHAVVLSLSVPQHGPFEQFGHAVFSPDGSAIVFRAGAGAQTAAAKAAPSLWIRQLDHAEPRMLPATEGALEPFWSPDSNFIGFFAQGKLKRIAVAGGPPQTLCDAPQALGGSWNSAGVIVFASETGGAINRVDARGGTPQPVTRLGPHEEGHRWPFFLPDGDHFLFLGDSSRTEDHHIRVASLRDGSVRDVMQAVSNATYAAPGFLLFTRAGALLAQPFDAKALTLSGEPRVLAEPIVENDANHHFEFSASQNGRLVYRSGSPDSQLVWRDRSGHALGTVGEPRRLGLDFLVSADQQRVIYDQNDADGRPDDIWILHLARGVVTRFTFDPTGDYAPLWSPDGSKVAFASMRVGLGNLHIAEVANPANVQRLTSFPTDQIIPDSWTHDGATIVAERLTKSDTDLWTFPAGGGEGKPYRATPFVERTATLSPDDSLIAYVSNESGRDEVYVERFPSHQGRRQLSSSGGNLPRWRSDGREMFYVAPGQTLMAIDMTSEAATATPLFRLPGDSYDVSRDGQRLLVDQPVDDNWHSPLTVVTNWMAESK